MTPHEQARLIEIGQKRRQIQDAVEPIFRKICDLHITFDQHKILIHQDGTMENITTLPEAIQIQVDGLTEHAHQVAKDIWESSPLGVPARL